MVNLKSLHLRHIGFFLALFVYGVFGSPTPDSFGWVEVAVGAGLVIAAGPLQVLRRFGTRPQGLWQSVAPILLVYGLSIPVISGVASGHEISLILRDMIPFLLLLLPYFMLGWQGGSVLEKTAVTAAIAFIGVAFGVRLILPVLLDGSSFSRCSRKSAHQIPNFSSESTNTGFGIYPYWRITT